MSILSERNFQHDVQTALRISDAAESVLAMEKIRADAIAQESRILSIPDRMKTMGGYIGAAVAGTAYSGIYIAAAALGLPLPEMAFLAMLGLGGGTAMAGHYAGEKIGQAKGAQKLKDSRVALYEFVYIQSYIDESITRKISMLQGSTRQIVSANAFDALQKKHPDLAERFKLAASPAALTAPSTAQPAPDFSAKP